MYNYKVLKYCLVKSDRFEEFCTYMSMLFTDIVYKKVIFTKKNNEGERLISMLQKFYEHSFELVVRYHVLVSQLTCNTLSQS